MQSPLNAGFQASHHGELQDSQLLLFHANCMLQGVALPLVPPSMMRKRKDIKEDESIHNSMHSEVGLIMLDPAFVHQRVVHLPS